MTLFYGRIVTPVKRSAVVRRGDFIRSCLSFQNINVFVKVLDLVFLFIVRIRFVKGKSIEDIFRSRYGEAFRKIR